MAVVETLSVILQAITGDFGKGLKKAGQETKDFEKQVKTTQRTLAGFRASIKGSFGAIGGKLGFGGLLGGGLAGFTLAGFAKESLKEHAKDNKELQASLTELDASFVQIKKNFGAWLTEVAGAGSIIDGFNKQLKEMSGENLNTAQASVNVGFLEAESPRDLKAASDAIEARQASLANQLAESRRSGLMFNLTGIEREPDEELKRAFEVGNQEWEAISARIQKLQKEGLWTKENLQPLLDLGQVGDHLERRFLPTLKALGTQGEQAWDLFGKGANMALKGLTDLEAGISGTLAELKEQAKADAMSIIAAAKSPLEEYEDQFKRLKFLKGEGLLTGDQAAAGLAAARAGLDQFRLDPVGSLSGTRRGSAEAFARVDAFRSQGQNAMENTWEQILKRAEEQAKLTKETNKLLADAFSDTDTVDTKP